MVGGGGNSTETGGRESGKTTKMDTTTVSAVEEGDTKCKTDSKKVTSVKTR